MNTDNPTTPDSEEISKQNAGEATDNTAKVDDNDTGEQASTQSVAELEAALAEAKASAEKNWALYLEAKAETDNVRKRATREVEDAHKFALKKFIPELLAVKDTLEMGIKAAEESKEIDKFIEGNSLTLKLFNDTLGKFNVAEVSPHGEAFNPELHQAMTMIESAEHPANTVVDVIQKGYTLNERLLRPALVVVSKGAEK